MVSGDYRTALIQRFLNLCYYAFMHFLVVLYISSNLSYNYLIRVNVACSARYYTWLVVLCCLSCSLRNLLYFYTPSKLFPISNITFGGVVCVSFIYIRWCWILIMVLWTPKVSCKDIFAYLLINISWVTHTVYFCVFPLIFIFGSGTSACFYLVRLLRPMPSPSSILFRWVYLMTLFPCMVISIDPPCVFHYYIYSRRSLLYTLRGGLISSVDNKKVVCCFYTVPFSLGFVFLWSISCDYPQIRYCLSDVSHLESYS